MAKGDSMKPRFTFKQFPMILLGLAVAASTALAADDLSWLEAYNVVWTTPSKHSGESMPVGGGQIGPNVWVEDGDVLFYVGQSGCLDENGLAAQTRARADLAGTQPVRAGEPGIPAGTQVAPELYRDHRPGGRRAQTTVRLWAEVHRPVVHVDVQAAEPISAQATFETWRYQDILLDQGKSKFAQISMAMMNRDGFPGDVWLYQDTIEPGPTSVTWFHRMRNDRSVFEYSVRQQGLEAVRDQLYDPLSDLTFGGMLTGEGFQTEGTTEGTYAQTPFKGWRFKSRMPAAKHHVGLYCHIEQAKTVETWKEHLQALKFGRANRE